MALAISMAASIVGMVLGTAGFVLGLLSYLRDKPRVSVTFNMNMVDPRSNRKAGMVVVTNAGRRAVHIGAVALEPPGLRKRECLLLQDSIQGTKLSEGDKPLKLIVSVDILRPYKDRWREVRAFAEDSTGRRYYSSLPNRSELAPSWISEG